MVIKVSRKIEQYVEKLKKILLLLWARKKINFEGPESLPHLQLTCYSFTIAGERHKPLDFIAHHTAATKVILMCQFRGTSSLERMRTGQVNTWAEGKRAEEPWEPSLFRWTVSHQVSTIPPFALEWETNCAVPSHKWVCALGGETQISSIALCYANMLEKQVQNQVRTMIFRSEKYSKALEMYLLVQKGNGEGGDKKFC